MKEVQVCSNKGPGPLQIEIVSKMQIRVGLFQIFTFSRTMGHEKLRLP
jgi:hypothetical protein